MRDFARGLRRLGDLPVARLAPVVLVCTLAFGTTSALAAQLYAAPAEAGAKNCSSAVNACSLEKAVGKAAKGDEVIVEPGSYGTSGTPLKSTIGSGIEDVSVHGVDTALGPPSAKVFSEATYGVELYGAGSTLRDLEIVDSAHANGGSLLLEGASGERLIVRGGPKERDACVLELTTVLLDSVCDSENDVAAIAVSGALDGPNDVTLRNVTVIAPNGDGIEAESSSLTGRSVKMTVLNTIARGGVYDIQARVATQPVSVTTGHSNYRAADIKVEGGASVADDGTSQRTGDQGSAELFVAPASGDFREALGAQTIGSGLIESANGGFDFDGAARVFADGTSCANTDIGADQFTPAAGPATGAVAAGAVGQTGAILSATANPFGGPGAAHFDFGPAASGGGPPTSYSSTPTQCLAVTDAAQPVAATLTGLAPGTTYYYRLVAANEGATTAPAFTATFTTAALPPRSPAGTTSPTGFASPAPSLTSVAESAKTWREGSALARVSSKKRSRKKRPPVGTTFSFALNESASVMFQFTESAAGRKVGKTCVAQTKGNAKKRPCTRRVTAATLRFSARIGTRKVSFDGVIAKGKKLKPGTYTLVIVATASGKHSTPKTLRFTITN